MLSSQKSCLIERIARDARPGGCALVVDHVIADGVPLDVGHVRRALHDDVRPHQHDRLARLGGEHGFSFRPLMALPVF